MAFFDLYAESICIAKRFCPSALSKYIWATGHIFLSEIGALAATRKFWGPIS